MTETREQHHEIEIDAPAERVWRALSSPEELCRWYVERAEVEPQEGGRYFVSWGPGMDGTSKILVWNPPHELKLAHQPPEEGTPAAAMMPAPEEPIIETFTIEARGETKCVLRLVMGGVPAGPKWDEFYDGTNSGWKGYFGILAHYLGKHPDTPPQKVTLIIPLAGTPAEAWPKLVGPDGFCASGQLDGLGEGDTYSLTTGLGDQLEGQAQAVIAGQRLQLQITNFHDALWGLELVPSGPGQYMAYGMLYLFGASEAEAAQVKERWQGWLGGLLGPA